MEKQKIWIWNALGMVIFSIILFFVNLPAYNANPIAPPTPTLINPNVEIEFSFLSAKESLELAISENTEDSSSLFQYGLILSITEPDRASGFLDKASELDPSLISDALKIITALQTSSFAEQEEYRLIQIGQALGSIGDWNLAKEAFNIAVQTNPEYAESWAYLGMSEMQLGLDAKKSLETALQLDPLSISANIFYAEYLASQDNAQEGLPYLHIALELDPENIALKYQSGEYYAKMGNLMTAFDVYDALLLETPDEFETLYQMANFSIAYEYQIQKIGLPAAREALALSPNNTETLILLGRAYSQLGNPMMGQKLISQALQKDPENINALYYLGIINISLGNSQEAKSYFERITTLTDNQTFIDQINEIINNYLP